MVTKTVTPRAASSWISLPEEAAAVDVDAGGRLVEEEHARVVQRAEREPGALADAGGQVLRTLALRLARARSARAARPSAPPAPRRRARRARRRTRRSRAATAPGRGSPSAPCSRCGRAPAAGWRMTSMPSTSICPAVGSSRPISMRMVVLLPEPLAPRKAKIEPRLDGDREVVDGGEVAEALGEAARPDDRRRSRAPLRAPAPSSVDSMSTGSVLGEPDGSAAQRRQVGSTRGRARRLLAADLDAREAARWRARPRRSGRSRAARAMARASSPQAR